MDKDDKKPAAAAPAPVKAPVELKKAPESAPAELPEPAELSAPTLTEGSVDELQDKRNEAGQLAPEDGSTPDPLADELKAKFSGEGGGSF